MNSKGQSLVGENLIKIVTWLIFFIIGAIAVYFIIQKITG